MNEQWSYWIGVGVILILTEFIIPGGIVSFLGLAAVMVGGGIYFGWITSVTSALLTWFITSIVLMLFLRSLFMKYFEGDTQIHNVDEDEDLIGTEVLVMHEIGPGKAGRVKLRDSSWVAQSEDKLSVGSFAMIVGRNGNEFIVKNKDS